MKSGQLKLGDFGIAKILSNTYEKLETIVGTPYYLSPEIVQNQPYSFKSDMWSLGVLLFELCAQNPPFDAASIPALVLMIANAKYEDLPNKENYSEELRGIIK